LSDYFKLILGAIKSVFLIYSLVIILLIRFLFLIELNQSFHLLTFYNIQSKKATRQNREIL